MSKKIIFLHIPKTAGRSIRRTFMQLYGDEAVAPLHHYRDQQAYSEETLASYRVITGHLNWCDLDFMPAPKVVFTLLRDPLERLASFYLYQRMRAFRMTEEELEQPGNRTARRVRTLGIDAYFCDPTLEERSYIDGLYDNFYAYYLAGRHFDARGMMIKAYPDAAERRAAVLERALAHAGRLDLIGRTEDLASFSARLSARLGETVDFSEARFNVNPEAGPGSRLEALMALGPSDETVARLQAFTELDRKLYELLCPLC